MLRVVFHQVEKRPLAAALRREDFHFVARALRQHLFQQLAVLKIHRDVNRFRQIFRFQVKLLQQRGNELLRIELFQLFPIKFAAVHHAPTTQMEKFAATSGGSA